MAIIFAGSSSSILHVSSSDNVFATPCHFIYSFKFTAATASPRRQPRVSSSSSLFIAAVAPSRQQTGGGGISVSTKLPSFPLPHHRTSKEKKTIDVFEDDPIADLNARIRRDQSKREASGRTTSSSSSMDPVETDKYIQLVKMQQQRGLQKLKGDRRSMMAGAESSTQDELSAGGFSYKVDPYTLRSGDYVVHKKVGVGRFVAIKNDMPMDSSVTIEYVFIEFGDGMAKLPVKQASRFLYRYNL